MINRLIGQRYEILEKIGESPQFVVYKARDRAMNRMAALKMVTASYAEDTAFMQGLSTGFKSASRLNHPVIAQYYELAADDGAPYAAMEFVRGIDLKERIRRIAPFTLSVAVDFACAIAEALQYAHSLGQAHGDIRPQNIIVSPEGAVKVTDFGIAAAIAQSPEAQHEMLLRSAPYHAPELSMKTPGTPAGDIYALGATLYEMLTGTTVFSADTPEALADMHAFTPAPSPRLINTGVPRSIDGIVLKCLQKRPESRYLTTAELVTDLKAVRDALRFGKSLSWSPFDVEPPATSTPANTSAQASGKTKEKPVVVKNAVDPLQAVSGHTQPMPTRNRLRAQDEKISLVLKILIGIMAGVILVCLLGFMAVISSNWVVPQPVTVPQLVGKPIDEAQALADKLHVHLIVHGDYMDKPRNIVYKTDQAGAVQIHPGHYINVWYSKGPTYVDVPNVAGLSKEEAEQKLRDAGLTVGKVMPQYSKTVPSNIIIRQTVSYKKRVLHDTAVDLIFSDGPQPDYAQDIKDDGNGNISADNNTGEPQTGTENAPPTENPIPQSTDPVQSGDNTQSVQSPTAATSEQEEHHTYKASITIPHDGKGLRAVRITYDDLNQKDKEVAEENCTEGEKIPISIDYTGKTITMHITYDGKEVLTKTFDPQKIKHIQGTLSGNRP